MKFPFVFRRKYELVMMDNDRLRIENSILRRINVDLEGSNNALRSMVGDLKKKIKAASAA